MESSKCKVQSSETEELKPCPFCGAELEYEEHVARAVKGRPILRLWAHPSGSCILAGMEVPLEDHPAWNRRERPSGKWEKRTVNDPDDRYGIFRHRYYCSACGDWQNYGMTRFCPCCGAKMEESE